MRDPPQPTRGRGALSNPSGRFEAMQRIAFDDGWVDDGAPSNASPTRVTSEPCRSLLNYNESADLPFDRSINPYRGCEHGCIYCFARPSHGYLGMSSGLDFETRILAKDNGPAVLEKELAKKTYVPAVITLGANTDPYQPIERQRGLTRRILEVLAAHRHPVFILTKSNLVLRDLDVLAPMAADRLVQVGVSITTLRRDLARMMEPRAATPERRLQALTALREAGVPTTVLCAPIIPALTDCELETVLQQAAEAGAGSAGYVLLRLPHEIKTLFAEWLRAHAPERAEHVLSLMRQCHDGALYDSTPGVRLRGRGPFATLLAQRFALAVKRFGLDGATTPLRSDLFSLPPRAGTQLTLFPRPPTN